MVENGVSYEVEPPIKDKVKPREQVASSNDFVSRGNIVKSSGHNDTIAKDGWKPTGNISTFWAFSFYVTYCNKLLNGAPSLAAQRAKQVSSDYLHSWKEVTRNSSSK